VTKRKISVVLICLILISVLTVRGQFVEGKGNQKDNDMESVSLSEQEIADEANNKFRSSFLENKGQIGNEEVLFYGSLPNGKIAFGDSKVMLWMEGTNDIITLSFVGTQKVSPIGLDEFETKNNYFLGNRGTYTNVRSFTSIIYNDLWKGIDLFYQNTPKGVKYEFRVAPSANPEDIRIYCEGQEQLEIGKDSLKILVCDGQFIDEGLKVLQEREEIDAKFVAKGSNTFGFQISKYDEHKPLVIDPLLYSTFVGGNDYDSGSSIALDSQGNVYVTGSTKSTNFPTTENAYNRIHSDGYDCFVFKLSTDGSSLLYSTFIGGSDDDFGNSIILDSLGDAYVTGITNSINFPTTINAYNRTHGGSYDCFVFKLSTDGSSLLYSTFIGGSDEDSADSIILDSEKNAYVTGHTASNVFPTTINAYDESYNGDQYGDCFVFKLTADGSSLLYSTFVGGNQHDYGHSIVLDDEGNAYVTGTTWSSDFPTTESAYNRTYDYFDCFVFKLSADGSSLLYSTYAGGSEVDDGLSIALDNEENVYITGVTYSNNFPTTENAYSRTKDSDSSDCFVFKLTADGSSLLYSTFIGGSKMEYEFSITLDNEGNAYVIGYTLSSDFPTTKNAYDTSYNGDGGIYFGDCFVFKLSADGSTLLYSTYIGGNDGDMGLSIVLDDEDNVYVTGRTFSSNFPTTTNAFDNSHNSAEVPSFLYSDCFVFKLSIEEKTKRFGEPIFITTCLSIFTLTLFSFITVIIHRRKRRK